MPLIGCPMVRENSTGIVPSFERDQEGFGHRAELSARGVRDRKFGSQPERSMFRRCSPWNLSSGRTGQGEVTAADSTLLNGGVCPPQDACANPNDAEWLHGESSDLALEVSTTLSGEHWLSPQESASQPWLLDKPASVAKRDNILHRLLDCEANERWRRDDQRNNSSSILQINQIVKDACRVVECIFEERVVFLYELNPVPILAGSPSLLRDAFLSLMQCILHDHDYLENPKPKVIKIATFREQQEVFCSIDICNSDVHLLRRVNAAGGASGEERYIGARELLSNVREIIVNRLRGQFALVPLSSGISFRISFLRLSC